MFPQHDLQMLQAGRQQEQYNNQHSYGAKSAFTNLPIQTSRASLSRCFIPTGKTFESLASGQAAADRLLPDYITALMQNNPTCMTCDEDQTYLLDKAHGIHRQM
jgi:hypothetical protein